MTQANAQQEEGKDFLTSACEAAGCGAPFGEMFVARLADELYRDRFAQLERTGAAKEDGIPLARVFIDLAVSRRVPTDDTSAADFELVQHLSSLRVREDPEVEEDSPEKAIHKSDERLSRAGFSSAAPAGHHGYVLIGGPGQGKSTVCQLLCQVHRAWLLRSHVDRMNADTRRLVEEITRPGTGHAPPAELRLPFAIVMPEAAAWLTTHPANQEAAASAPPRLLTFLENKANKRGFELPAASLLALLTTTDWLLVLDGLDEVPNTAGRDTLLREVETLLQALSGCDSHGLVIATTRPQGYAGELRGMVSDDVLYLVPLDVQRAIRYAEKLADARYSTTPERREKVVTRIKQAADQPTTARLMRSPLQVTILAALVDSVGRAPGERWSLFSEYYRVAYDRERERFDGSPATRDIADVLRSYRKHIDKIHAQVALLLHVEGEHAGRTDAALRMERFTQVVDAVLAEDEIDAARRAELAEKLRRAVTERLVLLSERSPGEVRFDVRAMQEFFAANALAARGEEPLQKRVLQVARATSFRQVLLFLASKAFAELSDLREFYSGVVCDHLDDDADLLVRESRPGAVFALEMLADGAAIKQSKYVRRLTERAVALLDRPPSKVQPRLAAVAMLDADAEADMQPVLEAAITERLFGRPAVERLGAWVAVLALVGRGVKWAVALADRAWGEMTGSYRELVRAVGRSNVPADRWLLERIASCRAELSPRDMLGKLFRVRRNWPYDPNERNTDVLIYVAVERALPRGLNLDIQHRGTFDASAHLPCLFAMSDKANSRILSALSQISGQWSMIGASARLLSEPTPDALARELDAFAESWGERPELEPWSWCPWPLRACLRAAESPEQLKQLAALARSGELGSSDDWRAAEQMWARGEPWTLEALLQGPGARWPLSRDGMASSPPLLTLEVSYQSHLERDSSWMSTVVGCLTTEPSAPIRAWLAGVVHDALLQHAAFRVALSPPLTSQQMRIIWENLPEFFLTSAVPSEPWRNDPHGWAELIHSVGLQKDLPPSYLEERAAWLFDFYIQQPDLHGLVAALAAVMAGGTTEPLERTLIAPERFSDARLALDARLVSLAQPWLTPEEAEVCVDALANAPSKKEVLFRASDIVQNLPEESPARAAALTSLWKHLPTEEWLERDNVREAAVSALRRTSGLDDARVWEQLQFSLPRPEIPRPDGSASDRPEPRPVHIDAIRFQNLRIFADFKMTPARPNNGDGQWIVIVGENGRGKTTLLRGVALALVDVVSQPNRLPPRAFELTWRRRGTPATSPVSIGVEVNGQTYSAQFTYDEDRGGQQRFHQIVDADRGALAPVFGYGCRRGSALGGARRQIEDESGTELYTLFDEGLDITHAETWLTFREIEALKEKDRDPDGPANRIYRAVQAAFKELFGLELLGNRDQQVFVRGEPFGEMPIGALSDGYLTMMGWIVDLLAKWIRRRRGHERIDAGFTRTMTGLVLLDEIDLHIHPAWQKDILRKVRSFFPKMSFLVTTHNPFTLVGARAEEIWILRPDEQGRIRADRGTEQPALLTAAAIYEAYFGDPRDFPHEVGADFHRYERLAASPIRSDEEEAELRLLLAKLRAAGFDPGWEPVPREDIPPYPGDGPAAGEEAP